MKKYLFICLSPFLITACNSNTPKEAVSTAPVQKDSIITTPTPVVVAVKDSVLLKDIELNEKTVLNKKYGNKLDRTAQKKLTICKLDPPESDGFNYYIYDSLYSSVAVRILLVTRVWPEENIVWLAIYDTNDQLLDFKQVFYENSEGAQNEEASIKNNLIKVTSSNEFEEGPAKKKTVTWFINSANKLEKK